jgi:hypothetical protein
MSNTSTARSLKKIRNHCPDPPTTRVTVIGTCYLNNARLNMTPPPTMRDLAHRLFAYEVVAGKTSEPVEFATLRVYEKLRQSLSAFAGVAAFESLAFRALTQAKSEAPGLWAVQVAEGGSLQGLGEFEPQIDMDMDKDLADKFPSGDGGIILIARLLGLLLLFLGEALTLSLLRNAWPSEAFGDRDSKHGRKA